MARSRIVRFEWRPIWALSVTATIASCYQRLAAPDECRALSATSAAVRIGRALIADSAMQSNNRGGLVVEVTGTIAQSPSSPAPTFIRLRTPTDTVALTLRTDNYGVARALTRTAGMQRITVHALGYRRSIDTISVRAGFTDTIQVRPSVAPMCLSRVKVDD